MFAIIGLFIVFGAVFGGFIGEGGPILILYQPYEFLIIGGAAIGAMLAGTPPAVLKLITKELPAVFAGSKYPRAAYDELLGAMFAIFTRAKREGFLTVEADLANPQESEAFAPYPALLANHHALEFLCDSMKLAISYQAKPEHIELAMDIYLETHHEEGGLGSASLTRVSDALPGLGIVAAVLGIIIALQNLAAPPEVLGHSISAALVGTFLGLLLSYGMIQPIAANIEGQAKESARYFQCIRESVGAYFNGCDPIVAVEIGRQAIYSYNRPTADQLDAIVSGRSGAPASAEGAAAPSGA
ncbi:MAG TPA: flagellar motor stator protein MotA [Pantanalinema sp.]